MSNQFVPEVWADRILSLLPKSPILLGIRPSETPLALIEAARVDAATTDDAEPVEHCGCGGDCAACMDPEDD